ncbi:hypothetical protein KFL_001480030 [Klebsormidium nitens]|uniref:N-acetyltransferase domain-containing protein n=1 Tax=Klebsormidium nitens TaxID=105231 RepID=A0A1Y1HXP6_KLENI|nr:hypothetical protein KFL_001480030 [Klebsormidium nitens]|eukprot:GAQ83434.1 hypothetical protein KFL_001480030 [Klebsormidium nitens]
MTEGRGFKYSAEYPVTLKDRKARAVLLSSNGRNNPQSQVRAGEGQARRKTLRCRSGKSPPNEVDRSDAPVKFRPAQEQDMAQIQWLILKEAMNPLNLLRDRFLVAEDAAGQLVACGQVANIPGDPPIQELRSLVVVKEHRGQGIGTRLLQELLGRIEGEVYLLTIGRAIKFYQRAGFEEVSDVPPQLSLELKLGNVVAKVAAQDRCLVMKATR